MRGILSYAGGVMAPWYVCLGGVLSFDRSLWSPEAWAKPGAAGWLLLAACVIVGAVGNICRTAWVLNHPGKPARGATYRGVAETATGERALWLAQYGTTSLLGNQWRPLRLTLRLCAPPEAGASGMRVTVTADNRASAVFQVPRECGSFTMTVREASKGGDVKLAYDSETSGRREGVGVVSVHAEPIFTTGAVLRQGLRGALFGLFAWLLIVARPQRHREIVASATPLSAKPPSATALSAPTPPAASERNTTWWSRGRALSTLLLVWGFLAIWAVIKPPLQAPDEGAHLLRANAVRLNPWVSQPDWLSLDAQFLNPLVMWPPGVLGRLWFHGENHLTREEVPVATSRTWRLESGELDEFWTPLATYPSGYYGPAFALAEGTTALLQLTPYQNVYAYRFVSLGLAGLLWLLVLRVLVSMPEVGSRAPLVLAFLLLNPMLAFSSSSVSPDAVNVPLGTLSVLLAYRTLMHGAPVWPAMVALLGCALTKPSALLITGSLVGATLVFALMKRVNAGQALRSIIALARAATMAFVIFYAWSPPRFAAGLSTDLSPAGYVASLVERLPGIWISYWGHLGYMDYRLASPWYWGLLLLVIINLVAVAFARERVRSLALFGLLVFGGYLAQMAIGEYHYLEMAGLNFQGRHVLPVCVGLCGLVLHDVSWARWSLVGYVGLMNALLLYQSFVRYFGGDWTTWWLSLPLS